MSLSPPLAANHGPMNHFHHYKREETRDSSAALQHQYPSETIQLSHVGGGILEQSHGG